MGNSVILLEFYKDGCSPCMQMMGVLEQLEKEYGDKITIHKVNVEKSPDLAAQYEVMSVPTLFIMVDGDVVYKGRGIHSIELLRKKLEPYV